MRKEKILKNIKNIFNKIIFLLEYIIAFIFVKEIFSIISIKVYNGYFSLSKIIYAFILGIVLIALIAYICIKNKKIVEKIFVAFAIPISISYAIFMLPLQVPDEGTHLLKAYDVSLGYFFPRIDEKGESYCTVVKDLENYSYLRFENYRDIYVELNKETNYETTVNIISQAQGYSPILYLAPGTAIIICRILGVNIFYAMYLGRIFNTIIFLVLGYMSIKKIPFGKIMLAIYLCMPMMMQQAASCSADTVLNATLIYYITYLLYLVFKENKLENKEKIILFVMTALVAMFKYVYILVAGLLFITIFTKKEERKEYLKTIGVMILIGSIFSVGWFLITSKYDSVPGPMKSYYEEANVDSGKQLEHIIEKPIEFVKVIIKEFIIYGPDYLFGAIGSSLGWLDVNINMAVIVGYIIILVITTISEESKYELKTKSKIWAIALIVAISILLKITMYLMFTPVGHERVGGVQGRYFTAILFLILLCMVKKDNNWKVNNLQEKMMSISMILNIYAILTVIGNYI